MVQAMPLSSSTTFLLTQTERKSCILIRQSLSSPPSSPWQPPVCILSPRVNLLSIFNINGIIRYLSLASFTLHNFFEVSVLHFFIWLNSIVWVPPFLYSSVHGLLAIVNSAAMDSSTTICLSTCFRFSWVYTYKWNCWVV